MLRGRSLLTLAFSAACLLSLGTSHRADAGLALSISDGVAPAQFYYTDDGNLNTGTFTLGNFTGAASTSATTFPGFSSDIAGSLSTTLNVGRVATPGSDPSTSLVLLAEVVNPTIVTGGATIAITGAQFATLTLGAFAFPSPGPFTLSSDASATTNLSVFSGTVNTVSNLNGTPLASGIYNIPAQGPPALRILSPVGASGSFAKLFQTDTLTNINVGANGSTATFSSSFVPVAAVPEPASLGMALVAGLCLGTVALRRKFSNKAQA